MQDGDGDKFDNRHSSASQRRESHSRVSDTDMFVLSSTRDHASNATEDAVVVSEDETAADIVHEDEDEDDAVDDDVVVGAYAAAEEPSASSSTDVISPSYPALCRAKRRSSVLPPVQKSSFVHDDNDDDVDGVEDTDNDVQVEMNMPAHIFHMSLS